MPQPPGTSSTIRDPDAWEFRDLLVLLSVVICLLAGWWGLSRAMRPAPPPALFDKPFLAEWTILLRHGQVKPRLLEMLQRQRAEAVPILVQQLGVNESSIERFLRGHSAKLSPAFTNLLVDNRAAPELRAGAAWGLLILFDIHTETPKNATAAEAEILIPALEVALADQHPPVRLNAAATLHACSTRATAAIRVCAIALKDQDSGVRYNAIRSLAKLAAADPAAIPLLQSSLTDPAPSVRALVSKKLAALGHLPDKDASLEEGPRYSQPAP